MCVTHATRPWLVGVALSLVLGCSSHTSSPAPSPAVATRSGPICDSLAQGIQAGTVHPVIRGPFPKRMAMPPAAPPADLRGRDLVVSWHVAATGQAVLDTAAVPATSNADYRHRLVDVLAGYTFAPAIAEGCAVPARYAMRLVLQ